MDIGTGIRELGRAWAAARYPTSWTCSRGTAGGSVGIDHASVIINGPWTPPKIAMLTVATRA